MPVYYVYILQTVSKEGIRQYYTGYTKDLYKRLNEHKTGKGAKFCRGKSEIRLKYFESFLTKSEAIHRELEIKTFSREKKEEMITNFNKK